LYCLIANSPATATSQFLVALAPQFTNVVTLKKLADWLAANFNLRGGGSATSLQGGGPAIDFGKFKTSLMQALEQQLFS
ncbi:MAG TPA: hypothetical protein VJJ83_05520, partial [Candidatus Babeliales bacterium]|nr:hypothetical protein [Candidatus Babeliales bacterium]